MTSLPLRTRLAAAAGLATAALSRRIGTGEGSVVGGRVTLALDPTSLESLAAERTVVLVSATNGKTTTTTMLAAALRTSGEVVTNGAGSNMFGGMVGALSASDAPLVVLETDEAHLAQAIAATSPRLLLLMNLTRDQLDRVSEVRSQAAKWRAALRETPAIVVANVDDPMIVWAVEPAKTVVWVEGGGSWLLDAASCPACGARIDWKSTTQWSCTGCALKRPNPHARLTTDSSAASDIRLPVETKIPGDINKNNAAMALTAAVMLGADPDKASKALAEVESPGGRFMQTTISDMPVRLVLAKNPAGWAEALRIVSSGDGALVVSINARVQDGRDPSWLWDVPFEQLKGRFVVATGDRGRDLAVRLRYAGVDHAYARNGVDAVRQASLKYVNQQTIDVMGNYSAFQDFRTMAHK